VFVVGCLVTLTLACSRESEVYSSPISSPFVFTESADSLIRGKVIAVVDGVTIDVNIDGQVFRVRYLGLEVPEHGAIDDQGRSLREKALDLNHFLVNNRMVELEVGTVETDLTGNLLHYVFVDGEMVNKVLLTNGYATVARFPLEFQYQDEFLLVEENAKINRRGIWESSSVTETATDFSQSSDPSSVPQFSGTLPAMTVVGSNRVCDYSGTSDPVIKANVDSRTGERVYHVPRGLFYDTTSIDVASGDQWLCTEVEAISAGWKRSTR